MSSIELQETLRNLVHANHILHYYGAVDGFGHISVRHPHQPHIYIMCGFIPPALVETSDDLIEYRVSDSDPVNPSAGKGYLERFIHGEIYKRYPEVQSVVHSHAEEVLPYAASSLPLKPMYHMSGFLGTEVPLWDIAPEYDGSQGQDMLVKTEKLGKSLAAEFSSSLDGALPEKTVVLMKSHGYTTHGKDIPTSVFRTIYTMINAGVQTKTMTMQSLANASGIVETASVPGLTARQAKDCQKMTEATQERSWKLWVREVERSPNIQQQSLNRLFQGHHYLST